MQQHVALLISIQDTGRDYTKPKLVPTLHQCDVHSSSLLMVVKFLCQMLLMQPVQQHRHASMTGTT